MELVVLGAGSPYPRPAVPCSGYLLRTDRSRVWIDPGPGTLANLLAVEELHNINAIWVSHLHADHTADLILAVYALDDGKLGSGTPIPVLAPAGLRERIAAFLGTSPDALDPFLTFDELHDGHHWASEDLRLTSISVEHGATDAYAVRAEDAHSAVVFTGDTRLTNSLLTLTVDADLLLSEANHLDRADPRSAAHLSAHDAGDLAQRSGARSLALTHIDADQDEEAITRAAAESYSGLIHVARAGQKFTT